MIINESTMSDVLEFVQSSTKNGLYNKNTGSSRATAIKKIIGPEDLERLDIKDVDVDALVRQYGNKHPGNYSLYH